MGTDSRHRAGTDWMADDSLRIRLLLWILVVAFCAVGQAYLPFAGLRVIGPVSLLQVLLVATASLGLAPLLNLAGGPERSITRTTCRIVVAYLLFELLAVIPVAIWLGSAGLFTILGTMGVRVSWLLFPVMLSVCEDERARRLAGTAASIAALGLVAWGIYVAATAGGGYYMEFGEARYRILPGMTFLLTVWPLVLAASGAIPRRFVIPSFGVAAAGLALTNHRSAVLAFVVSGAVCLIMSGHLRRVLPILVPLALGTLIVGTLWSSQASSAFAYTLSHLLDFSSGNGLDRVRRWGLAADFFLSNPFNDLVWSWRYYSVYVRDAYQPHNFLLEVAVTEGLVGLTFYGTMLWTPLRAAWARGREDPEAQALIGWLVAYTVFSLLNANHYLGPSMPLLVGALAALVSRVNSFAHVSSKTSGSRMAPHGPVLGRF